MKYKQFATIQVFIHLEQTRYDPIVNPKAGARIDKETIIHDANGY